MSPQPRNTKIMRREGPWGRAGWFRSRYLTLTDATAGRLERSLATVLENTLHPCHLPQARSMDVQAGPSHRQPPHQAGEGRPQRASQLVGGGYRGKGVGAGHWRQHCGLPRARQSSGVATFVRNTEHAIVLVSL